VEARAFDRLAEVARAPIDDDATLRRGTGFVAATCDECAAENGSRANESLAAPNGKGMLIRIGRWATFGSLCE
jgi:hypothetical protein